MSLNDGPSVFEVVCGPFISHSLLLHAPAGYDLPGSWFSHLAEVGRLPLRFLAVELLFQCAEDYATIGQLGAVTGFVQVYVGTGRRV